MIMEELEKKSKKGLEKFAAEGGDIDKVNEILDSGIDKLLDDTSGTTGGNPSQRNSIRYWLIILFGIILIGFLGYSLWKKTHQEVQPQKYFAQYFEVLPSPQTNNIRGLESKDVWNEGFSAYNANNFADAAHLLSKDKDNPEAMVYSGIAYLNSDQTAKAIQILNDASSLEGISSFEDIRQWYLALAYLKAEDIDAAKSLLSSISVADHYKKQQAKELLEKLK